MTEQKNIGRMVLVYFFGTVPMLTLMAAWAGVVGGPVLFFIMRANAWNRVPPSLWPQLCILLGLGLISGVISAYVFQKGWDVLKGKELVIIGYGQVILATGIALMVRVGMLSPQVKSLSSPVIIALIAFGVIEIARGRYKQKKNL